jgi:hypothetical protein
MKKYEIEENIDFFNELNKALNNEKDTNDEYNNKCLISNQPLVDKFIEMDCGHKFNYIPLYNDLINHKTKYNYHEQLKLSIHEIRCPYCRKKQQNLLPYYKELGVKKINGVNYKEYTYYCQYKIPNKYFKEYKPETKYNMKLKNCSCKFSSPSEIIDENKYCYKHKKLIINEEKEKLQQNTENIILGPSYVDMVLNKNLETTKSNLDTSNSNLESLNNLETSNTNLGCIQILKKGPNKGKKCGCSIKKLNLCLRHFKLLPHTL